MLRPPTLRRRQVLQALGAGAAASLGGPAVAAPAGPDDSAATATPPDSPLPMPAWHLLDGPVWSPAELQDTALVLVYFSTTCGYCRRHNQRLDGLARATRGQALRVLGVAEDTDAERVRQHWREQGHAFPVTLSDDGLRARLTRRRVIPLTLVLDRTGRLRELIPGEMAEADVLGLARWARPVPANV